jgi:hypothetical protein
MTFSISQGTLSSSFWPKSWLLKWNTHPIPPIWLWMTSVSKNKLCLRRTNISQYWRHA